VCRYEVTLTLRMVPSDAHTHTIAGYVADSNTVDRLTRADAQNITWSGMTAAAIHRTVRPGCGGPDHCDWCTGYADIRNHNRAHTDNVIGQLSGKGEGVAAADYAAGVEASVADQSIRVDPGGPLCFGDRD
jgi:hypothetical protein